MHTAGQRIQFIVNPISGRRRLRREAVDVFRQKLERVGHHVEVHHTTGSGDAAMAAGTACNRGVDLIVVAGGDGTVHEAIAGMAGAAVPVLIAPCGTENVVAKFLGLRLCVKALWSVFLRGKIQSFRPLVANGRRVLFALGVGFDAEVVRQVASRRRGPISYWSYVMPILRTLAGRCGGEFRLNIDGEDVYQGPGQLLAGKVPRYALGLKALHRADPADDFVDVLVLPRRHDWQLALDAARIQFRPDQPPPGALYRKGRRVRITAADPVGVQMDGEFAGTTPLDVTVGDQAVQFLTGAAGGMASERTAPRG